MTAPQLIIQDFGGAYNADPDGMRARVIQGGTWKRARMVVILPSAGLIPAKVALSHWNLAFPPNNGVVRILALGQEVGEAYSNAIAGILADPNLSTWEYILTIEHDNMPPPDGALKLVEQMENHPEFDGIGGLYHCQGPGGCPHLWGDPTDPIPNYRPQPPNGGLQEVCGTSMGFNLWRMSLFKDERIPRPWFKTQKENGVATQDLYFASNARKFGHRFAVDCQIRVGHFDFDGSRGGIPDMIW